MSWTDEAWNWFFLLQLQKNLGFSLTFKISCTPAARNSCQLLVRSFEHFFPSSECLNYRSSQDLFSSVFLISLYMFQVGDFLVVARSKGAWFHGLESPILPLFNPPGHPPSPPLIRMAVLLQILGQSFQWPYEKVFNCAFPWRWVGFKEMNADDEELFVDRDYRWRVA